MFPVGSVRFRLESVWLTRFGSVLRASCHIILLIDQNLHGCQLFYCLVYLGILVAVVGAVATAAIVAVVAIDAVVAIVAVVAVVAAVATVAFFAIAAVVALLP